MQDEKMVFCMYEKKRYFYMSNKQNKKYYLFGIFVYLGQTLISIKWNVLLFNLIQVFIYYVQNKVKYLKKMIF